MSSRSRILIVPGEMRVLSKARFDKAVSVFRRELRELRLEATKLVLAEIYWCPAPQVTMPHALGFFVHHSGRVARWLGYAPGHIFIPALAPSGCLRDVLRHEAGHALAHYYPALIRRSATFRRVFGGSYDQPDSAGGDSRDFVSDYATTNPAEDFAETFMFFMKHRGQIPARFRGRIPAKWTFIRRLVHRLTANS